MVRTSLETRDKAEARRRLREWEDQVVRGERPTASKVTWDTTDADLAAYYSGLWLTKRERGRGKAEAVGSILRRDEASRD